MREKIEKELKKVSPKEKADHDARFFKTGKGEYSEEDLFLGISNPDIHKVANRYREEISIEDTIYFLKHEIHEYRLLALDILKYRYEKGDQEQKKEIVDIYLNSIEYVNNWDLVDLSAPYILGDYLLNREKDILYELAKSNNLWAQRIAIIATLAFIKEGKYEDSLKISQLLLNHQHDLIHKAIGWMLREIWKREPSVTEGFIKKHYENISRTTLRYAIERMKESKRQKFLKGEFD
jgi:3-methyladenine DNA glycosylase AlkD